VAIHAIERTSMSKARKEPRLASRLRLKKEDLSLPKLFDIIALVAFVGAAAVAGGGYVLDKLYTRSVFVIMMYCLVTFGLSYAMGRFMKDQGEDTHVRYFKYWLGGEIVIIVLLVLSLGLFY
jgi:hypothetical protein